MKNNTLFLSQIFVLFLLLLSCQDASSKVNIKSKSDVKNAQKTLDKTSSKYSGKFAGVLNEVEIMITLKSTDSSNKIGGELVMNGERATISASETNGICEGFVIEDLSKKKYVIRMEFASETLNFSITFPEYDNQTVTFQLTKIDVKTNSKITTKNNKINAALVGTWRFTEVLNSGSGEFYASLSTDYFLQLLENGTCITWTGKSAGGTNSATIDSNSASNMEKAQWYTNGNSIIFVNPDTKKEVSIPYYAEENVMKLKGSVNRLYQRID